MRFQDTTFYKQFGNNAEEWKEAINACKEALEQPAQGIELEWYVKGWDDAKKDWQGLTDDEINKIKNDYELEQRTFYARAIEQALKDKNNVN